MSLNITNKLIELGITRDSVVWFWGKLTGTVLFLAAMGAQASHYGIPAKWTGAIQIAALWLTYFSAQQSTSKLYGDANNPVRPII